VNAYERLLVRIGGTRAFAWFGRRVLTRLDRLLHGSRLAPTRLGTHLPLCLVTTVGRRSGRPHTVPLLGIPTAGDGIVVAATNFGSTRAPAWARNLQACPRVVVEQGGERCEMVARTATAAEAAALWSRLEDVWPHYATYRSRAGRPITLYVLEPAPPAAPSEA